MKVSKYLQMISKPRDQSEFQNYVADEEDHSQSMSETIEEINANYKIGGALFQGDMLLTRLAVPKASIQQNFASLIIAAIPESRLRRSYKALMKKKSNAKRSNSNNEVPELP
ncbi:hypothetical protein KIN20_029328 [Parelaphostrongylus tenuis]|uniref:Uncharacterized protein n=1 Tax=Parelaphostrongylus tenuis TaxID=148309 RepID=A0AAD5WFJ4_PARTN|nr:hypothetical protein KIN20_029328 [Parelaphostrongylus tenuis]